jgi:hypothetical protein
MKTERTDLMDWLFFCISALWFLLGVAFDRVLVMVFRCRKVNEKVEKIIIGLTGGL